MQADIEKVLIDAPSIRRRVHELARQITADFGRDSELTIVPILTGAMIFAADLMREMPNRIKINLMTVSSYPGTSVSSQGSEVVARQLGDVHGRHVLLIDDILDSGGTLNLVVPLLKQLGAASVRTCVLLRKDRPAARAVHAETGGVPRLVNLLLANALFVAAERGEEQIGEDTIRDLAEDRRISLAAGSPGEDDA